jgi:methylthioribose-1-phosphate isomerase
MTLIPDSAAGHLMYQGKVDVILFGADRVAANGDVANKIGTFNICMMGQLNHIPRYACVPVSTIDLSILTGSEISIEQRDDREVTEIDGVRVAPLGVKVYNPAFDITPSKFITGIITEAGVCYPPYEESIREAVAKETQRGVGDREARLLQYVESIRDSCQKKKLKLCEA